MVQRIMATMCPTGNCGQVLVVSNPNEKQLASARTNGRGQTILSYSPRDMNYIASRWGINAVIGTIAHEIGHHFDFNSSPWAARMRTVRHRELRADWFAGCALAKLGIESGSLAKAVQVIGEYPTHGYPDGYSRSNQVQRGYTQCGGHVWPNHIGRRL